MKQFFGFLFLILTSVAQASYTDNIFEEVPEANDSLTLHSRGLLSYGAHSNTFHLRHFFLRANYQKEGLQFFTVLNGYADTHNPAVSYTYSLNNINLYDYGFNYRFLGGFFFSPRAAATYREDYETFLSMTAYIWGSPAEFDPVNNYLLVHRVGPGIRLGYSGDRFEVGYSQGDFRHTIPAGFLAKYRFDDFYLRAVYLTEYLSAAAFDRSSLRRRVQLSGAGRYPLTPLFTLGYLGEVTFLDDGLWRFRFEQAMEHNDITLGIRELFQNRGNLVIEASIKRRLAKIASIGVQYATTGAWYLVGNVDF